MRMVCLSVKNGLQNKKQTLLNLTICMATVVLLSIFAGNLISIREQIVRLSETMEVKAIVSNLCGSMNAGLKIKETYVDGVLASEYIVNPTFSTQLKWGFGEFGIEDYLGNLNYYGAGCNDINAIPGLQEQEISMQEGADSTAFFTLRTNCV